MQFKDSILGDVDTKGVIDTKYLNMLNERTPVPFSNNTTIISREAYSTARDNYQKRLNSEMQQFNSALDEINIKCCERLSVERNLKSAIKKDVKIYAPCLIVFLVAIVGLFLIVHFAIKNGTAFWVKDAIVEETSFQYFFSFFSHSNNTGFEVGITAIALAVALYIGLLIFAIVRDHEWLRNILLGGLIVGGLPFVLLFLAIRLLFVGLGYVVYFLLTPYGLIVVGVLVAILIVILGWRVQLKGFKVLLTFTIILTLTFTGVLCYFSKGINDKSHVYYNAHNGASYETAKELSIGKSSYALLYDDNDAFYFVITPNESGTYEFSSKNGERISINLYLSNYSLITSDTDDDISLEVFLIANETYYLKVVPKESCRGHYKISCYKT